MKVIECLTLTVPEAARLLGISRNAGYEACARGDLPGVVRIGRSLRVSRLALEEWLRGSAATLS